MAYDSVVTDAMRLGCVDPVTGIFIVPPRLCNLTPILIDTNGDGIKFGARGDTIWFDLDANGTDDHVQWVRPGGDEEFLALDRNGNGIVDDGSELFGSGTPLELQPDEVARHGYQALRQYDRKKLGGNNDKRITNKDQIWERLLLWNDLNADGISTENEVTRLSSRGYVGMTTKPQRKRSHFDDAGN
ncbi:MAG: hypothetical protein AAF870_03385, partial [Pseudomonadota bacterium]